ncbi:MAG: efflux transporter outer membrane subunit [Pirellula sp.]|nr:efflux transporter outer membrane subunit [Pirellula sp.]
MKTHDASTIELRHFVSRSRREFGIAIVSLAFGAYGCRVGPDFVNPTPPSLGPSFQQSANQEVVQPLDEQTSRWWTYFDDPILQMLIADASQQNLTVREAYYRIAESRALLGRAKSQFFPQVNATSDNSYRRLSQNNNDVISSNNQNAFWNLSNGFESTWEIDLWGRLARGVEAANAELLAQHESLNDIRVTLLADVATTYIQIRVLQQRWTIADQNLELQKQTLHIVQSRQEAGIVGQLDQSEAESNVAVTTASIPPIQQELQVALYRLSVLLGQVPGGEMGLENGFGQLPMTVVEAVQPGMPAELLTRRPDIRKAYFDVMAANARIGIAVADRLPQLTIRGNISVDARDVNVLYSSGSLAHNVGPGFRWDILNFGRLKRNIEAREASHQQSVIRYEAAVLRGVQEVESALVEYQRQKERTLELEKVVTATNRSVEISLARYEQNLITFDRVLDAQRSLAVAQGNLIAARGDILFALVKIYRALGGGWGEGEPSVSPSAEATNSPVGSD